MITIHPFLMDKKMRLFAIILLIFIAIVAFLTWGRQSATDHAAHSLVKHVVVHTLQQSPFRYTVSFLGTVKALKQTDLVAKTQGILEFSGQSGTLYKKGDVLAEIENGDRQKSYALLQETATLTKAHFERAQALIKTGAISQSTYDEKKAHYLEAQRHLADAKNDQLSLKAPFNGVLGITKIRSGTEVNTGDVIATFYDPDHLCVELDIPLVTAKQIHKNTKAIVKDVMYPISDIHSMQDDKSLMCPMRIDLPETEKYAIGEIVDVGLIVYDKPEAIVISDNALFMQDGTPHVFCVVDNKAVLRPVTVGHRYKDQVEIIQGLTAGEVIIQDGHHRITDGEAVKTQ